MTTAEITEAVTRLTGCNPKRLRGRRTNGVRSWQAIDASCLLVLALYKRTMESKREIAAATGYPADYVHRVLIRGRKRYRECAIFRKMAKTLFYEMTGIKT